MLLILDCVLPWKARFQKPETESSPPNENKINWMTWGFWHIVEVATHLHGGREEEMEVSEAKLSDRTRSVKVDVCGKSIVEWQEKLNMDSYSHVWRPWTSIPHPQGRSVNRQLRKVTICVIPSTTRTRVACGAMMPGCTVALGVYGRGQIGCDPHSLG